MLKNTIENLDGVEEKYQEFYSEKDGVFELDENLRTEDNTALLKAKNYERDARKKAEQLAKELKETAEVNAIALAEAKGDLEERDRLLQKQLDSQKAEYKKEADEWKGKYLNETIGKLKSKIASEVYLDPDKLNLSHISDRVKLIDGVPQVVDSFGAVMNEGEYIKELKEDSTMAHYIKAGKGSGGGTVSSGSAGASNKAYSEMTTDEKKAFFKAKRQSA